MQIAFFKSAILVDVGSAGLEGKWISLSLIEILSMCEFVFFQVCESQRVVILDLSPEPQRVEIVNLQPFEDDESREQDLTSSPTNTTTESRYASTRYEMFRVLSYQKPLAPALKPKCDPLRFL